MGWQLLPEEILRDHYALRNETPVIFLYPCFPIVLGKGHETICVCNVVQCYVHYFRQHLPICMLLHANVRVGVTAPFL